MISILQLQYFQMLAREQHLTRTAEELHISQSTLSMMIKKMEEELGAPLFDRRDHRILLNEYGTEYLKYVNMALENLEQGKARLQGLRQRDSQKLSLSVSHAQVWMKRIFEFKKRYPSSYIAVYAEDLHRYAEMLCDGTLDFVISGTDDFADERVEHEDFSRNRLTVCLREGHPLAARKGLYLKELNDEPYIDLSPGLPFRHYCDKLFEKTGAKCNRYMECDYDMRRTLVAEGRGYALTPNAEVTRNSYAGCAFVPLLDECAVRTQALFWKKGRSFTPLMQAFADYLKQSSVNPL